MPSKLLLAAAGTAAILLGSIPLSAPARAQAAEAEILGLHQLCDKGERKACIRFGMLLEKNRLQHERWRKLHAEWFWWER
jgi:hypothetical protein